MDTGIIGKNIAELRKKAHMTQSELAHQLGLSDKAVSKWENGHGYPDITVLPDLASLFGVTIDYIMLGEKKGIAIAGNMLVDIIKNIECYPKPGMLTYVDGIGQAVGGCMPNTAINLAKIDSRIPIKVFGKVGTDENGRYLISQLQKNGIDVSGISYSSKTATSFSDVMSMATGERTFFHKKGANTEFSPSDVNLNELNCSIFHIGYILLLDTLDAEDEKYGTVMAHLLHDVQKRGIKTSVDVVSSSNPDEYKTKVIPALKYCDYAFMNEIECCSVDGVEPRTESGELHIENIKNTMEKMASYGVKEKIIVHSKEKAIVLDVKERKFTEVSSLKIPKDEIKGSVGAGDAFCAGCLYGLYNNFSDTQLLEFASAAAACNLFEANSVDGMRSRAEIMKIAEKYGRL